MPAFFSEGCVALAEYLDENEVEQKDFADEASLDAAFLNHLLKARKRPSLDTASAIETASKGTIPARLWSLKTKKPKKAPSRSSSRASAAAA